MKIMKIMRKIYAPSFHVPVHSTFLVSNYFHKSLGYNFLKIIVKHSNTILK